MATGAHGDEDVARIAAFIDERFWCVCMDYPPSGQSRPVCV